MTNNKTISECLLGTQKSQKDIPFFDRCMYGDVTAFFDYALILQQSQKGSKLAIKLKENVRAYIKSLSAALDKGDKQTIKKLLSGLSETKYTGLGYSESKNDGSGLSGSKVSRLYKGLKEFHEITKRGNATFLIIPFALDKIKHDGASDMLTAILKSSLIEFTQDLAVENNWDTKLTKVKYIFNQETAEWEHKIISLPHVNGTPVILYPKQFINNNSSLESIFTSFKTYLFNRYIKHDEAFRNYWQEGNNYITQKQFREILKVENIPFKSKIRAYLKSDFAILDAFESMLIDVEPLTDEQLEMLQTCRVNITAA